jgi:AcrR family transcriptional regulator
MARPRSEDKRNAILAAAAQVVAEQGVSATTARIAKAAGVAEGSLFTYFSNKDELLNQLYLALKAELRDAMMSDYPASAGIEDRSRHVWSGYVQWGVARPCQRKVLAQLSVSDRITAQSKAIGMQAFADAKQIIHESISRGFLRDLPAEFVSAIMGALAEVTMDFMAADPANAERYGNAGFETFWHAIARH